MRRSRQVRLPPRRLSYSYPMTVEGRTSLPIRLSLFGVIFMTDPLLYDIDVDGFEHPVPVNVWKF